MSGIKIEATSITSLTDFELVDDVEGSRIEFRSPSLPLFPLRAGIMDGHDQHPLLQLLRTQQTRAITTIPKVRNKVPSKFPRFRRPALTVTPN
jgi:hypothetical protein